LNFVASEQDNPPTSEPAIQDEIMTHSEPHTPSPKPAEPPTQHSPKHTTDELAQNNTEPQMAQPEQVQQPPFEPITNNTSSPSSPNFGPAYKPLTKDELILPLDFALPIQERMMKEAINIDDEPIPLSLNQTIDLSKIKIILLKRKRPESTIPFN
jgi:hypothetical protein